LAAKGHRVKQPGTSGRGSTLVERRGRGRAVTGLTDFQARQPRLAAVDAAFCCPEAVSSWVLKFIDARRQPPPTSATRRARIRTYRVASKPAIGFRSGAARFRLPRKGTCYPPPGLPGPPPSMVAEGRSPPNRGWESWWHWLRPSGFLVGCSSPHRYGSGPRFGSLPGAEVWARASPAVRARTSGLPLASWDHGSRPR
jgi:hypothetical protein